MSSNSWGRSALACALIAAVAVSGCSLVKKKKPTLAYEERPVELLFDVGAADLDRHNWSDAVNYFREVERQHPYSEWSRRAILMTAYAHYQANAYADAIADADRFITLYPGNAATPYAYYLKAICYFEQIVDVGRDQASTESAQGALGDIIKRYPRTEYAADAQVKLDMVSDQLAGKEMTIGRYYLRNNDPIAAIGRFRNVVEHYQTTSPRARGALSAGRGLSDGRPRQRGGEGRRGAGLQLSRRHLVSRRLSPIDPVAACVRPCPPPRAREAASRSSVRASRRLRRPPVDVSNTGVVVNATLPTPPVKAAPKPKKNDFLHGVLGL